MPTKPPAWPALSAWTRVAPLVGAGAPIYLAIAMTPSISSTSLRVVPALLLSFLVGCTSDSSVQAPIETQNTAPRLTEQRRYSEAGKLLNRYTYTYDSRGALLSIQTYDSTGANTTNSLDSLDEKGRIVVQSQENAAGVITKQYIHSYHEDSTLPWQTIELTHNSNGSTLKEQHLFEHDAQGLRTAMRTYDDWGYKRDGIIYTNSQGRRSATLHYDVAGDIVSRSAYSYTPGHAQVLITDTTGAFIGRRDFDFDDTRTSIQSIFQLGYW